MDDRCNDSLDVECLKLYVWHCDGVDRVGNEYCKQSIV